MGFDMSAPNSNNKNGHKAAATDKLIVKYQQDVYDISEFMRKHPGGVNALKDLNNADMTARFMKAPPHSDAAMYLLHDYKIKTTKSRASLLNDRKATTENGIELIDKEEENEEHANSNNNNKLDDSMEHLVDWSKPMIPQIAKISEHYDEWVHKPVDRPLRMFGPNYLEICTKTPWWLIPLFWIPVILKCLLSEFVTCSTEGNNKKLLLLSAYFVLGILFWTLLEYSLHRWVFHMRIDRKTSAWLCTLHFLIHGLHHKVPFDPMRLVFPPVAGAIIASAMYTPISFLIPYPRILLGGALFGYLCYDMMHYYLHYGNPQIKHMHHMKRYHYQHHFAHQDMGYGISSPLWDVVFNTRIQLRKLRFHLKWN